MAVASCSQPRQAINEYECEGLTCELSHASDSGTTAGREDVSDLDLLDEALVDAGALDDVLKDDLEELLLARVLEAALPGAGDGSAARGDDDDVVGVLGEEGGLASAGVGRRELRDESREAVLGRRGEPECVASGEWGSSREARARALGPGRRVGGGGETHDMVTWLAVFEWVKGERESESEKEETRKLKVCRPASLTLALPPKSEIGIGSTSSPVPS